MILRWFLNKYTGFRDNAVKVVNNGPFVLGTLAGLTLRGWLAGESDSPVPVVVVAPV